MDVLLILDVIGGYIVNTDLIGRRIVNIRFNIVKPPVTEINIPESAFCAMFNICQYYLAPWKL